MISVTRLLIYRHELENHTAIIVKGLIDNFVQAQETAYENNKQQAAPITHRAKRIHGM